MTPEAFAAEAGVSRETLDRLRVYADLLVKWNRRINLVGRSTLPDLWRRHMLDSAQLYPLLPARARSLVDLGSGAGFPGMVLAIMGVPDAHLIESDRRKCAFLRAVARATGTPVTIHAGRIESVPGFAADVIVSRALAELAQLLDLAENFLGKHSILLFLKGRGVDLELTRAAERWKMRVRKVPSRTDSEGSILRLEAISRALRAPEPPGR
ncbi:MAG TPA: 16S rRNA (guanine(527)-N(7))-methyltransferase RsmG [Alphaproteobacteria bacterium]|nr:16S rRNA (guanine(527)-N(7))-methyltransferase RsmG [Alphaproteobacteria bacterium]